MTTGRNALGRSLIVLALALATQGLGAVAWAGPPAARDPSQGGGSSPYRSFRRFADGWMKSLEANGRRSAGQLGMTSPGASSRFRRYGSDYQVELRPTGQSRVPFVGILRYVEERWRCPRGPAAVCKLSKSTPVSEVFRYQDGRWVY